MSSVLRPTTYGVQVGDLWVHVDFEAQAVDVARGRRVKSVKTEDLGNGFLVDYDKNGDVVAVEILGAHNTGQSQESSRE